MRALFAGDFQQEEGRFAAAVPAGQDAAVAAAGDQEIARRRS